MGRLSEREGVPKRQQPDPRIVIGFGKVVIDPVLRDFVMNRLEEEGAVPDSAGAQPSA